MPVYYPEGVNSGSDFPKSKTLMKLALRDQRARLPIGKPVLNMLLALAAIAGVPLVGRAQKRSEGVYRPLHSHLARNLNSPARSATCRFQTAQSA